MCPVRIPRQTSSPELTKSASEAKGFKSIERPNVLIEVATDVRADFTLQPASHEMMTINEDIPLVNTTSSTLGGTLSNQEINDLPLNGRNYENCCNCVPVLCATPAAGFRPQQQWLRAEDNSYFIEACSIASLIPGRRS